MPASADRSHLSIGEVLSLLQDEFPDVTISKIRFLESQGLLDPERTPSGYRKFYETDIERLRWILRQQKDNYLPLKVIKDRLDDIGQPDQAAAEGQPEGSDALRSGAPQPGQDAGAGRTAAETTTHGRGVERRRAGVGESASSGAPSRSAASVDERAVPSVGPRSGGSRRAPADTGTPTGRRHGAAAATPPTRPMRLVEGAGSGADADPVSFTIEELAAASGLSVRDLRELEHFGLLSAGEAGVGPPSYDGDALVVARVAGGFLQHGIEARHLRSYRVAVDREAGLFQQIVAPLLKQRNPEAHRRAARTVTELMQLGEAMRAALLRHELRDHVDH